MARLKRVILIGDHHQLPPVVKNMAFQKYSHLDQSLFTRFVRLGTPFVQLNAQVLFLFTTCILPHAPCGDVQHITCHLCNSLWTPVGGMHTAELAGRHRQRADSAAVAFIRVWHADGVDLPSCCGCCLVAEDVTSSAHVAVNRPGFSILDVLLECR